MGREILEKALRVFDTSLKSLKKSGEMDVVVKDFSCANEEELFIHIGSGKFTTKSIIKVIPSIKEEDGEEKISEIDSFSKSLTSRVRKRVNKDNAVIVDGIDDLLVRLARCCNPIPGDPITGYITRGRGVTVHTSGCPRVETGEIGRSVYVEWNSEFQFKHPVNIRVITHDKPGVLSTISKVINGIGVNIRSAMAKSLPDRKGSFIFEIEVKDYSEL